MTMKVTCRVETYDDPAKPSILVHSHWNEHSKVVLEVNGEKLTIVADDLIAAVKNCTNIPRN